MAVSAARQATFVAVATLIALGPAYARLTHPTSAVFEKWDMFHRRGVGICDAEFLDGREEPPKPLDRFSVLATPKETAPRPLRRMDGEGEIDDVARRLCRAMGKNADVRVRARCSTPEGWRQTHDASSNACRQPRDSTAPSPVQKVSDGE
jgi:hypothetical protein